MLPGRLLRSSRSWPFPSGPLRDRGPKGPSLAPKAPPLRRLVPRLPQLRGPVPPRREVRLQQGRLPLQPVGRPEAAPQLLLGGPRVLVGQQGPLQQQGPPRQLRQLEGPQPPVPGALP